MIKQRNIFYYTGYLPRRSGIYALIVFGIMLRVLFLDADPYSRIWSGYITDEGFWNSNARNAILFDKNLLDFTNLHFFIAPIFQSINYFVFLGFGVSHLSARIFPALCGTIMVVMYFRYMRNTLSREALFLGLCFFCLQPEVLMLSRISNPEAPLMLIELLIFFLISFPKPTRLNYFFSAIALLFGDGVKATFLFFSVVFAGLLLGAPIQNINARDFWPSRLKIVLILCGLGLVSLVAIVGWIACCNQGSPDSNPLYTIIRFLNINSLYSFFTFPFSDPIAPVFNFFMLGIWVSLIGWLQLDRGNARCFRLHRLFVSASIWFVLYFLIMTSLQYFPERYKVHIFLPMILMISIGATILQENGLARIDRWLSEERAVKLVLKTFFYVFPASLLFSIFVRYFLESIFGISERFLFTIFCIAVSCLILFCLALRFRRQRIFVQFIFLFPFLALTYWNFLFHLSSQTDFWITNGDREFPSAWIIGLLACLACSIFSLQFYFRVKRVSAASIVNSFSAAMLITFLVWIAPLYANPRYTLRDTSISLGEVLADSGRAGTINGMGLFLDNDIEYLEELNNEVGFLYPQYIVSVFDNSHFKRNENILNNSYSKYLKYYIDIYPGTYNGSSKVKVSVYKKN